MPPLCFGQGFFPFRDTPFFVSVDKAKELLGFEAKHAQPGQRERPRRARSPALARAGPHLPRLTCLEATPAPGMAGNLPPPPRPHAQPVRSAQAQHRGRRRLVLRTELQGAGRHGEGGGLWPR